jgi:hypothetical protein
MRLLRSLNVSLNLLLIVVFLKSEIDPARAGRIPKYDCIITVHPVLRLRTVAILSKSQSIDCQYIKYLVCILNTFKKTKGYDQEFYHNSMA